jgi:RNA polymerase sigma factor (sigma-70 family)
MPPPAPTSIAGRQTPWSEFERLLTPLIPVFYRHAYRWTASQDEAEDLVQELLLRLYPRLEELAALERLQPWALKVMYRIFVDQLRRRRNSPVRPMDELPHNSPDSGDSPLDACMDPAPGPPELVERELTADRLEAAWQRLGEHQRIVVALHDVEGYGLEEISELLDVPTGTLKSRLHRARARLRELLSMEPPGAAVREMVRGESI